MSTALKRGVAQYRSKSPEKGEEKAHIADNACLQQLTAPKA